MNERRVSENMRRAFVDRDDMIEYLREQFPVAVAKDNSVAEARGGRTAAEQQLRHVNPRQYAKTRNHLKGDVTRLSPYIRYGVLSLAEVRDFVLEKVERKGDAEKLVNELAWRDYWQRKYREIGDGIWIDQEPYKTGFSPDDYKAELPEDIRNGETGLACIDAFADELHKTGYLHNHARMWVAAYVVHFRRVKWQTGAKWFLQHLLDGDPASNNLSWQWVASTFSHKPYFFNRENIEKYTDGIYCETCPLYGRCDFEGTYSEVERRVFPHKAQDTSGNVGKKRIR
jgi:deoxyribodipyrimidine photo-lyase